MTSHSSVSVVTTRATAEDGAEQMNENGAEERTGGASASRLEIIRIWDYPLD